MANYEDSTAPPLTVEGRLMAKWTSRPHLEQLRQVVMEHVLTGTHPPAAARAVLLTAHMQEPGALFVDYYDDTVLGVTVATRRRLIDLDTLLKPYYGAVRPAMDELRLAQIDPAVTAMWLEYFRSDNALYRVIVVAGMLLTGALLEDGFRVTV